MDKRMDKNTLKSYFLTGKKPTQGQFAALIDSLFHMDEQIEISNVKNLSVLLENKVEKVDVPHLINLDSKQDCISDMLQTVDKSIVGAINELKAQKVGIYQERTIIIAPRYQEYAKILSVKLGSFVLDLEVNEYPSGYYYGYWDKSYTSRKYNDRLMISASRSRNNAYTLRTKDFAYNMYITSENGYTDIYMKADGDLAKMISLRLSFATNNAEDAVQYYEYPVYVRWDNMLGIPAIVDTIQNMNIGSARRINVGQYDTVAGYKELNNLVDYADFIINMEPQLPEGFYFDAANVGGKYYLENSIYRFLFNTEIENFTVKAGGEVLFTYPGIIPGKEILTAISPDTPNEEWTFSLSKPKMISSDDSINVTFENGVTDLTVNRSLYGQGGVFEITPQNVEQVVVEPDVASSMIAMSPEVRKLLIPADTETLVLSCPIGYTVLPDESVIFDNCSILQICAAEGSFKNGQVLNVLNNGADRTRISTLQSEGYGYTEADGSIVGYGGMYIDNSSFGVGRKVELVYWNEKWFTTTYNYTMNGEALNNKQDKYDYSLNTANKYIVSAINELNELLSGTGTGGGSCGCNGGLETFSFLEAQNAQALQNGRAILVRSKPLSDVTVSKMSFMLEQTSGGTITLAVFDDKRNLLAQTTPVTLSPSGIQTASFENGVSVTLFGHKIYYLGMLVSSSANGYTVGGKTMNLGNSNIYPYGFRSNNGINADSFKTEQFPDDKIPSGSQFLPYIQCS